MRLSFPNGEHADLIVDSGVTEIGSAQGNTIVLKAEGVMPWHARIVMDKRGIILEVTDPQARTHVNARPVQERALLRLGDVVSLEAVAMTLKPDRDGVIDSRIPPEGGPVATSDAIGRVVLRGVSGRHYGKTIKVGTRLLVGRGAVGLDLDESGFGAQHAVIGATDDAIHLRDLGSTQGTLVNGVNVRNAVLHPGDQLAFGRSRFVLEAPGYPARGQGAPTPIEFAPSITQTLHDLEPVPPAEVVEESGSAVWWLLGVAALIGLGIAALFWFGGVTY